MTYQTGQMIQDPNNPNVKFEIINVQTTPDGFQLIQTRPVTTSVTDFDALFKANWGVDPLPHQRRAPIQNVDYGTVIQKIQAPNGNFVDGRGFGTSPDFFSAPGYFGSAGQATLEQARGNLTDTNQPQFQADAKKTLLDSGGGTQLSAGNAANYDPGAYRGGAQTNQVSPSGTTVGMAAVSSSTGTPPNPSNPWFGIPAEVSRNFTSNQQAIDYWKNPVNAGGVGGGQHYQILDLASMAQYSSSDYERLPTGEVVLKPGVVPKPGTTKVFGAGTTAGGSGTGAGSGTGLSSTGNPELDELLKVMQGYLDTISAAGNRVNPGVEITPETVQQFLDQATKEIDPYYQNLFSAISEDTKRNLQTLQAQYQLQKEELGAKFKQTLDTSREDRAGAGTYFSGGRGRDEQALAADVNRSSESAALSAASTAGSLLRGTEEKVGTSRTLGIGVPAITTGTADLSTGNLNTGRSLDVFSGINLPGSLEAQKMTDIGSRQNQLELAERQRRSLNIYNY